jgi:ribosomal protein S18 acetylase RimI-like enzyme
MAVQNSPVSIRKANLNDIPVIQEIANATWPVTYANILTPEALQYMLKHFYSVEPLEQQFKEGHLFFLGEVDNMPIGFAGISEVKPGVYKLHKLYVLPNTQKTGAGKALLNHAIKVAKAAKASQFILNVNRYNPAKGFYERMGFNIIAEEDVDIGNGIVQEDYVMTLDLFLS